MQTRCAHEKTDNNIANIIYWWLSSKLVFLFQKQINTAYLATEKQQQHKTIYKNWKHEQCLSMQNMM